MERSTRRDWLGALGAGLAVSVSGCQAIGIGGGNDGNGDDPALYEQWVPRVDDVTYRVMRYLDQAELRDRRETLPESVYRELSGTTPFSAGVGGGLEGTTEALDLNLDRDYFTVARGEFDADAIEQSLESEEYGARRENGAFTVFEDVVTTDTAHEHREESMAVSPSYYVETPSSHTYDIGRLLATGRGERPSLPDGNDDVAQLFDAASGAAHFTVETYATEDALELGERYDGAPADSRGALKAFEFGTEETTARLAFVFPVRDAADPDGVQTYLDESRVLAAYDDVDISRDGRLVTVEATVPTRRFHFLSQQTPNDVEEHLSVHFNPAQSYGGTAALSIRRGGGDEVAAVIVRRNGEEVRRLESLDGRTEFNLDVERGDVVTVHAVTEDGEERVEGKFFA